jgi:hypothetical protein
MGRMSVLTALPESFAAGTTVEYIRVVADHLSTQGWTFELVLSGRDRLAVGGVPISSDIQNPSNVGGFSLVLAATETRKLRAGVYTFAERVSSGGLVETAGQGLVTVTPDVMAASVGELESPDERELRLVIALIEGREAKGIEAFQIVNRSVNYTRLTDLWQRRAVLEARIARAKRGGQLGRNHLVSFRESGR